eukprot:scaffold2602_cov246-Pinguiococcus_pyrenoidosus.AAC.9
MCAEYSAAPLMVAVPITLHARQSSSPFCGISSVDEQDQARTQLTRDAQRALLRVLKAAANRRSGAISWGSYYCTDKNFK